MAVAILEMASLITYDYCRNWRGGENEVIAPPPPDKQLHHDQLSVKSAMLEIMQNLKP